MTQGLRSECIRIADTPFFPTDCYEPSFSELVELLRILRWAAVGAFRASAMPAVPFLASLAQFLEDACPYASGFLDRPGALAGRSSPIRCVPSDALSRGHRRALSGLSPLSLPLLLGLAMDHRAPVDRDRGWHRPALHCPGLPSLRALCCSGSRFFLPPSRSYPRSFLDGLADRTGLLSVAD